MKIINSQMIMFMTVMITTTMTVSAVRGGLQSGNRTRPDSFERAKKSVIAVGAVAGSLSAAFALYPILKDVFSSAETPFEMIIENHIVYPLEFLNHNLAAGYIIIPAQDVPACGSGFIAGRGSKKTGGAKTNKATNPVFEGSVSWCIILAGNHTYLRIHLRIFPEGNILGIFTRVSEEGQENGRERFYNLREPIVKEVCVEVENVGLKVCGIMGTNKKPAIIIRVLATKESNKCKQVSHKQAKVPTS